MTGLNAITIHRSTLTSSVYEALKDAIVQCEIAPGTVLTETAVARSLNVSKTPVREAFLRLREIALLYLDSENKLRVIEPSIINIQHAYETRAAIEGAAAAIAARLTTSDASRKLKEIATASQVAADSGGLADFQPTDWTFHRTIALMTRNPMLARIHENSYLLTAALRERDMPNKSDSRGCARQHAQIAEAIEQHDSDEAERQSREHVMHVQRSVIAAYNARPEKPVLADKQY